MHSFILAQVFGLYLLIIAIIMALRVKYYQQMVRSLKSNSDSIVIAASIGIMLGLLLVTVHNIWEWKPSLIVTLLSWFILVKSILWLAYPEALLTYTKTIYGGNGYYVVIVLAAVLGILLMSKGFYPFLPAGWGTFTS